VFSKCSVLPQQQMKVFMHEAENFRRPGSGRTWPNR